MSAAGLAAGDGAQRHPPARARYRRDGRAMRGAEGMLLIKIARGARKLLLVLQ
ncbi:MAG: hypothetical protein OD918_12030 [Gammaproteobacteria bacterium]